MIFGSIVFNQTQWCFEFAAVWRGSEISISYWKTTKWIDTYIIDSWTTIDDDDILTRLSANKVLEVESLTFRHLELQDMQWLPLPNWFKVSRNFFAKLISFKFTQSVLKVWGRCAFGNSLFCILYIFSMWKENTDFGTTPNVEWLSSITQKVQLWQPQARSNGSN